MPQYISTILNQSNLKEYHKLNANSSIAKNYVSRDISRIMLKYDRSRKTVHSFVLKGNYDNRTTLSVETVSTTHH